jgi:hypothetical protein
MHLLKFSHELVVNPFNAFCLFAKDMRHYISWCYSRLAFVIVKSKSEKVVYVIPNNLLYLKKRGYNCIKTQLKFMDWYDDEHIMFSNTQSKDNFVKVLKVIFTNQEI